MKKSPQHLFEVSLRSQSAGGTVGELLRNVILGLGVPLSDIAEYEQGTAQEILVYFSEKKRAEALLKKIKALRLKKVAARIKPLAPRDWQDRWKTDIRPFQLTKHFDVVPVWAKDEYRKNKRTPLLIDTTMAFGTGLHETTRFMAQLIDATRGQFKSFLDIGTGTGLLCLVAYRCGAGEVWAVDIDRESIRVANKNLAVNGYRLYNTRVGDFRTMKFRGRFDFVAANLITHDLIAMRQQIVACVKPQKYLAVSGISLANLRKLRKEFAALPLRCRKVVKGKEWAALLYQRIDPKAKI